MSYYKYPNGDILLLCSDAIAPTGYQQDAANQFLYHKGEAAEWTPPDSKSEPVYESKMTSPAVRPATLMTIITSTLSAFVSYVKSGGKQVTKEIADVRIGACRKCEHRIEFMNHTICGLCWCCMDIKTKLPSQECPIGVWYKVSDEGRLPCGAGSNKTVR